MLARDRGYRMSPAGADRRAGGGPSRRRDLGSSRTAQIVQLVASGAIVVACGGGGVPVVQTQSGLVGVEAVIDKDLAACILAQAVEAQALLILTDVDAVYSSFGTPQQKRLAQISARQARTLLAQGNLGTGWMGPKWTPPELRRGNGLPRLYRAAHRWSPGPGPAGGHDGRP